MWLDTRGARHSRDVIGGPLLGYSPRALATLDPPHRRCSLAVRRRPRQPHAPSGARRARGRCGGALVPGAGRLSDHALHRPGGCEPCLDERRLAHGQPAPRPARVRPCARAQDGPRSEQAAAAGRDRHADRRRSSRGRRRSRHQPRGAGRHRHPRPALGCARLRCDRRGRAPHDDQHHLLDLAALSAQEDRPDALDRDRPGSRLAQLPGRQQPRGRRPLPALAARELHRRRAGRLRAPDRVGGGLLAGQRRDPVYALDRGRALPGRRPPGAGRLAQPLG